MSLGDLFGTPIILDVLFVGGGGGGGGAGGGGGGGGAGGGGSLPLSFFVPPPPPPPPIGPHQVFSNMFPNGLKLLSWFKKI
jgi:hypothetical protein